VADLLRIASGGTGILPQGELHPDLVNRLANEASKTARHVLNMCIRALDYCPPTDITFGDYLRAIITADLDLVEDDSRNYRLAFIDAFRKRGIYPEGIKTLSVESLAQPLVDLAWDETGNQVTCSQSSLKNDSEAVQLLCIIVEFLRSYANEIKYINNRKAIYDTTKKFISDPNIGLHNRIYLKFPRYVEFEKITGLAFIENPIRIGVKPGNNNVPSFQIQNLRLVSRVGPDGNQLNYVLFSIIQRSGVVFKDGKFSEHYTPADSTGNDPENQIPEGGFEFRGGCTLIFDVDSKRMKYAISKPLLDIEDNQSAPHINLERAQRQYFYQNGEDVAGFNEYIKYFSSGIRDIVETFNLLHQ
jgi:hypothetical protein